MPDMTAAEAIHAIRECAYYAGADVHSPALVEEAGCAGEAIREAFAERDALTAMVVRLRDQGLFTKQHLTMNECQTLDTARARLEAK